MGTGKYRIGARVRLTKQHDSGGPKVGAVGTIHAKGFSKGERDVIWDGEAFDGHSGEACDGSTNHWYVPKSKLEPIGDAPAAQERGLEVGDRVRVTGSWRGPRDGVAVHLDETNVLVEFAGWGEGHDGATSGKTFTGGNCWWLENSKLERITTPAIAPATEWVPKVGDRVRMKYSPARGEGAIIRLVSDGAHVRYDDWNNGHDGHTGDGSKNCWWSPIGDLEPLPVAEQPAAPAPLTIEAGKSYKTRDGRRVGPMHRSSLLKWPWGAADYHNFCRDDGTVHYGDGVPHLDDLAAEWVEPVEPAPAAQPATSDEVAVKVGDRVWDIVNGAPWMAGTVSAVNSEGEFTLNYDDGNTGSLWWSLSEWEHHEPAPAAVARPTPH